MRQQLIDQPSAWKGPEIDYRREMMHRLDEAERAEIDAALRLCGQRDIPEITVENFPLPRLGALLKRLRDGLLTGPGVLLLRGLDPSDYGDDDLARIYVGIGRYLGDPIAQSFQGELLGSIIDVSDIKEQIRGYNFGGGQNFHTDGTACDIVSLMCLRAAVSGGASRIVSGAALYNAMRERHPALLDVLCEGYVFRYNEWDGEDIPAPIQTPAPIPVFARDRGGVCVVQETSHVRNASREGGVVLTPQQTEAFNALQQLAKSPEFYLDMEFEPGDMQFLNNRVVMHGRTDYEDAEDVTQRRYMLRLWLNQPEWPTRPADQIFATRAVVDRWRQRRRPMMDLPSHYLREAQSMQAERRQAGTLMPRVKGALQAGAWTSQQRQ